MKRLLTVLLAGISAAFASCGDDGAEKGDTWFLKPEAVVSGTTAEISCRTKFADGVLTEGYQTYTYSDDFSYYAAGVPSTVNGFLLQKDMEHVHPFYIDYYHTQYDTPDTYNDAVMAFNLRYYGALAIYIDQMPALQLDFTAQYTRLKDALDADIFAQSGADAALYRSVVESLLPPAQALKTRIDTLNARYLAADEAGDIAEMTRLRQAGRPLIRKC